MPTQTDAELEFEKLKLDRLKAKLDFWKFVLASVFAAIAIAAIPPSFQLATAYLEHQKSEDRLAADQKNKEADRLAKADEFRENHIKLFLDKAVDQDIELRLRFAEYFASVSSESFRVGWDSYREHLQGHRDDVRHQIDRLEDDWARESARSPKDNHKVSEIERNLEWLYKEVGYVERNRSVSINPRVAENQAPLVVIARSQRVKPVSGETVSKFIPSPIQESTLQQSKIGECLKPNNESFLSKLNKAVMIPGQSDVAMVRELWNEANVDITDIPVEVGHVR